MTITNQTGLSDPRSRSTNCGPRQQRQGQGWPLKGARGAVPKKITLGQLARRRHDSMLDRFFGDGAGLEEDIGI